VENRLRNLSVLVDEYQTHILDLVRFSWISPTKENTEAVLTKIFISMFRGLKKQTHLPLYMFIYRCAIKTILRSKNLPSRLSPSVKAIDTDVNIEEFEPKSFKNADVIQTFKTIRPGNRIILCLNIRHKLSIGEIATLFSVTPGTILTRLHKSRIRIAKQIIKSSVPDAKRNSLKESRECFFIKNMEPSHRAGFLQKDETSRVSKHIAKCSQCKNFYDWHDTVSELIEKVERPTLDNQINKHIFYRLEKLAFIKNLFYHLRHNWMIKVPAIAAFLVILVLALSSYHFPVSRKVVVQKAPEVQSAQPQAQVPLEKRMTYQLTTKTTHRNTVGRKINELLTSINARPAKEGVKIMDDNGVMTYFHFLINKGSVDSALKTIKTFDSFEVKEQEDTTAAPQTKEDVRIEIWVKRKNAN
jgi:DNA-directed RNA polymerase specialized sigma24 family protein